MITASVKLRTPRPDHRPAILQCPTEVQIVFLRFNFKGPIEGANSRGPYSAPLLVLFFVQRLVMGTIAKNLRPGDKVSWNTSRGKITGVVMKKLTHDTHIKTHKVSASKENPEFLVESEKSGKKAAHKPSALKKVK